MYNICGYGHILFSFIKFKVDIVQEVH